MRLCAAALVFATSISSQLHAQQPVPRADPSPAPAYPTPAYPPYPAYPRGFYVVPQEIEYEEGAPVPFGYDIECRPRKGLVIAGAVTFGAVYGLTVLLSALFFRENEGIEPIYVPAVGPFIAIGTTGTESFAAVLVLDGVAQSAGLAMFIAGLAAQKPWLVYTGRGMQLSVAPSAGKDDAALSLHARF